MTGASTDALLTKLGLTADETRAYVALLERGQLTASQLAQAAAISRGRIYDVVRGLLAKGVALEAVAKVRAFEAVKPEVAVANLLERERRTLSELEAAGQTLVESLSNAEAASGPPAFIESLRHHSTIAERFAQLQDAAVTEILMLSVGPYYATRGVGGNDAEIRALQRGVTVRCIYENSAFAAAGELEAIQAYIAAGEEARGADRLPTKLVIVDRSVTMLLLSEPLDRNNAVTLVFRHPGFAHFAAAAFEHLWEQSEVVDSSATRSTSA